MPVRGYAVGVSSAGDTPSGVERGLKFLNRYVGIRVMVIACHLKESATFKVVERFRLRKKARIHYVPTTKLVEKAKQDAAIRTNIRRIKRLMPRA